MKGLKRLHTIQEGVMCCDKPTRGQEKEEQNREEGRNEMPEKSNMKGWKGP